MKNTTVLARDCYWRRGKKKHPFIDFYAVLLLYRSSLIKFKVSLRNVLCALARPLRVSV